MFRFRIVSLLLCCAVATLMAQPKMRFERTRHDFGMLQESVGSVSHEFRFVNTGSVPLILTDVRSSCDCTVPEWPKEPILPQKQGVIKVVFETTGNPGIFDKAVTVYSNVREGAVILRITGNVERSDIPAGPEFVQSMGGLRLTRRYLSLGEISNRQVITGMLETFNPGKQSVKIAFSEVPPHIEVLALPAVLQPGAKGQIRVVYDASLKKDWGFVSDRIPVVVDGQQNKEFAVLVTADISEDFSKLTPQQKQMAPKLVPERTVMVLGNIRMNEKRTFPVVIRNSGKSSLVIRKIETGCACLTVVKAPASVAAGATATIECAYVGEHPVGQQQRTLVIRTNDPLQPLQSIRIQAQIVE